MAAIKLNRFSLGELGRFTIRCNNCGAGISVGTKAERYNIYGCPECMQRFGEMANDLAYAINRVFAKAEQIKDVFTIEFDVEET